MRSEEKARVFSILLLCLLHGAQVVRRDESPRPLFLGECLWRTGIVVAAALLQQSSTTTAASSNSERRKRTAYVSE